MKLLNDGLTSRVALDGITVPAGRLRKVSEAKVAAIMSVIELFGFIGAIEARRERGALVLVDGAHRLEAAKRLGLTDIPVVVFEGTKLDAQAREISANMVGGMTPLQDALFLAEWKRVYEEMFPQTKQGFAGAAARHGQPTNLSFAKLVAEQRECDVRNVERRIAAVNLLSTSEIAEIEALCPGSAISAIEALGKIGEAEQRGAVIGKLRSGTAKKVSAAIKQVKAERGEEIAREPVDPVEAQLSALMSAWERAGAAARGRFLEQIGVEMRPREVAAE